METKQKPQTFVISVIGDGGVGKSNLCLQFLGKKFQEIHDPVGSILQLTFRLSKTTTPKYFK